MLDGVKSDMMIISACLCGINCKYNGSNNYHPFFYKLLQDGTALPLCPEQLGGLPTPREAAEIRGGSGSDVLSGRAAVHTLSGRDVTSLFTRGARETLYIARSIKAREAVLKSNSPSCGVGQIYDGTFHSRPRPGHGVTAALLAEQGFKIVSDLDYIT